MNLTFDGKEIKDFRSPGFEAFPWRKPDDRGQLVPHDFMKEHHETHPELVTKGIYLRYGTCQVKGPSGVEYALHSLRPSLVQPADMHHRGATTGSRRATCPLVPPSAVRLGKSGRSRPLLYEAHSLEPTLVDENEGRRNDIKPGNILVFKRAVNQNPIFKLTDFGLGAFTDAKAAKTSHKTANLFGVFQDNDGPSFETLRQEYPGCHSTAGGDRFWYAKGHGSSKKYYLKPAVTDLPCELRTKHCAKLRAFGHIIDAIEGLLDCGTEKRMRAAASVVTQNGTDLSTQGDFYRIQHQKNVGKPDSSIALLRLGTEGIDPDIDDRSPAIRTPSRAHSITSSGFSNIGAGSSHLPHEGSPGESGGLGIDLEDLSAPAPPDDKS
ncbi:hypothetical protein A1O7_04002 [Cladophialophora yegresii CBS 114405]|uniref:Protein kinase domain-containing protein n=1 Tax=Cladophialophora yegresii CBS 114405 TaxID=1182544 RepID=W9W4E6_9EURO|nr:uncharacterized protein A1O7_04002 [Cladophialophora yegresii CBS 114405]EXJ59855.1 hypothetical protein A1O7_04002 [Cladophialophora yegresii CBS 114405]